MSLNHPNSCILQSFSPMTPTPPVCVGSCAVSCFLFYFYFGFGFWWHKLKPSGDKKSTSIKELPISNWPVGKFVEHFLDCWLIWEDTAHCGWCWSGPGVSKKAGWASYGDQASEQHSTMDSLSGPVPPVILWFPWMMNYNLQAKINSLLPAVALGHGGYHRNRNAK